MKNQVTWVDNTVTNPNRAIACGVAVLGKQDKKHPAQDFVFEFSFADTTLFRFNGSVYDLTISKNCGLTRMALT